MSDAKGIGAFYLPCFIPTDEWPDVMVGHEGACGWMRYAPERVARRYRAALAGSTRANCAIGYYCSACDHMCGIGCAYCPSCGARIVGDGDD